ncbi:hypothetical protein BDV98DRAFT_288238 [Pterulicium gracile]|uniref:Uncharacterized protein n=1 Tax=Pterulicium gracile TaxID=1884261 RepID=A0A5C3QT90_9AGAR|nr:hypothetical protein BDV98DRAFT_288238 [Pterula gracilis]
MGGGGRKVVLSQMIWPKDVAVVSWSLVLAHYHHHGHLRPSTLALTTTLAQGYNGRPDSHYYHLSDTCSTPGRSHLRHPPSTPPRFQNMNPYLHDVHCRIKPFRSSSRLSSYSQSRHIPPFQWLLRCLFRSKD